jgi:hypothetical protein
MLWTLIVILLVLWLVGWRGNFLGENNSLVHVILVIVVVLLLIGLL